VDIAWDGALCLTPGQGGLTLKMRVINLVGRVVLLFQLTNIVEESGCSIALKGSYGESGPVVVNGLLRNYVRKRSRHPDSGSLDIYMGHGTRDK
jgi:hypothetical protein